MVKKLKKDVRDIVGASVGISVGGAVLGGIPGGSAIVGQTIGPAGRMMGPVIVGSMAKTVLDIIPKQKRRRKRR